MSFYNGRTVGGENHPTAKLTNEFRLCIHHAKGRVPARSLAKIFGVSERTVRDQWQKGCPGLVSAETN